MPDASDVLGGRAGAVARGNGYPVLDVEGVAGPFGDGVLVGGAACGGAAEDAWLHQDMMRQRRGECQRETARLGRWWAFRVAG